MEAFSQAPWGAKECISSSAVRGVILVNDAYLLWFSWGFSTLEKEMVIDVFVLGDNLTLAILFSDSKNNFEQKYAKVRRYYDPRVLL